MINLPSYHSHWTKQHILMLILVAVLLPQTAHGGRYSDADGTNLTRLVAPLVIVGVILIVMLSLLGFFYYRKKRLLCACICCREFQSKHTIMKSGAVQCPCVVDKIVVSSKMCDNCVKYQGSQGSLTLTDCVDAGNHSDGGHMPEMRICRCSVSSNCGSSVCHSINMANQDGQNSGILLTLENMTGTVTPPGDETVCDSSTCPCPCVTPDSPNSCTKCKSEEFTISHDTESRQQMRKNSSTDFLLSRELSVPPSCDRHRHCLDEDHDHGAEKLNTDTTHSVHFDNYTGNVNLYDHDDSRSCDRPSR